jgi:hypothetical protein
MAQETRRRGKGAAILTEAVPCQGCTHAPRCARDSLSCDDFAHYLGTPGSSAWAGPRLTEGQRFPTRATYVKVHAHHPTKAETAWREAGKARTKRRGAS